MTNIIIVAKEQVEIDDEVMAAGDEKRVSKSEAKEILQTYDAQFELKLD